VLETNRAAFEAQRVDLMGRGVHGGTPARVSLLPANANSGILFSRMGHDGKPHRVVSACPAAVRNTDFATVIGDGHGGTGWGRNVFGILGRGTTVPETDPNPADAQTVTIDWGDGTTSTVPSGATVPLSPVADVSGSSSCALVGQGPS